MERHRTTVTLVIGFGVVSLTIAVAAFWYGQHTAHNVTKSMDETGDKQTARLLDDMKTSRERLDGRMNEMADELKAARRERAEADKLMKELTNEVKSGHKAASEQDALRRLDTLRRELVGFKTDAATLSATETVRAKFVAREMDATAKLTKQFRVTLQPAYPFELYGEKAFANPMKRKPPTDPKAEKNPLQFPFREVYDGKPENTKAASDLANKEVKVANYVSDDQHAGYRVVGAWVLINPDSDGLGILELTALCALDEKHVYVRMLSDPKKKRTLAGGKEVLVDLPQTERATHAHTGSSLFLVVLEQKE